MIFKNFRFYLLLLLLSLSAFSYSADDLFWMNQIEGAIKDREGVFQSLGINENKTSILSTDIKNRERILSLLDVLPEKHNAWHSFIKGLLTDNSIARSDSLLSASIRNVSNDPGNTWLLFIEYTRYKKYTFADTCMFQLARQLSTSGANASQIISSNLRFHALNFERQKNIEMAKRLYRWMTKFTPDQTWPVKRLFFLAFPTDFDSMKSALISYNSILQKSWLCQFNHLFSIYTWIRAFLAIFMIAVFILVIVKYFPTALHFVSDLYPQAVSSTLRILFASIIVLSTALLSIYTCLWIVAILVWQHVDTKDKSLFTFALLVLLLAPIDCRIIEMSNCVRNPDGAIMTFHHTVSEGYSAKFNSKLQSMYNKYENSILPLLSPSISAYKSGDLNTAQIYIDNALMITDRDPVILVMAGNIAFQKGLLLKARQYYEKASKLPDRDISALFNLSQCFFRQSETMKGTELIDRAVMEDRTSVNSFISQNDLMYSKNWPVLRQVMLPNYTPSYFWKKFFPENNGSWKSANRLWGTSFLGFDALTSFLIFSGLFIFLLFISFFKSPSRIRKLFECKFCGRICCKKCAHGILCSSCDKEIAYITTDKKLDKIQLSITRRFSLYRQMREAIIDMIIPGASSFINPGKSKIAAVFLLSISSAVYASYFSIIRMAGNNCIGIEFYLILILLLTYNIIFIAKGAGSIARHLKSSSRNQI